MTHLNEIDNSNLLGIPAYWFGCADVDGTVRLGYGDGRIVRVGETLTVDGDPVLCKHGLHASRRILDAMLNGTGPILACVRLSGAIIEGSDKLAATARETVWMGDVSSTLHRFACDVAERALLREREAGRPPDPRSWAAITVKRRWLAAQATDEELDAAQAAAEAAAAWSATVAAAWAAAVAAAWAAKVVWSAACGGAWAAAWSVETTTLRAERAWQEAHLRGLLRAAAVPVWDDTQSLGKEES